jgi:class 3 adenylate cyclase/DNA-binding XRE family transcriptional regulator
MDNPSFGMWVRRRRKALDLTQEELARCVGCATVTVKRIEGDERRPSRQLAARLAGCLQIAGEDGEAFVAAARAERSAGRLPPPTPGGRGAPPTAPNVVAPSSQPSEPPCPDCGTPVTEGQLYCGRCGASLARGARRQPVPDTPQEERRWATVMFADLVGFTALAEQLDPEDVRDLVGRGVDQMGVVIERFGGSVVNVMGDAILAVFGAPLAHEDDPLRALSAALALRDTPLSADAARPLQLHIGVNTGEVLATMHGPAGRRSYTVIGDTVNIAERLLRAAQPGCVLVGAETYRATRHAAQYQELAPLSVKGKRDPVAAWELLDLVRVAGPLRRGSAPLVGRDDELKLLCGLWERAWGAAEPQLALLIGEPGAGKSRLTAEFERLLPPEALVIHGRCLPYGEALGYGALAMAIKEAAGIVADDGPADARARLGALVARVCGPTTDAGAGEIAWHLALLTGLDGEEDRNRGAADQRMLHRSARRLLEAFARATPLSVVVEDIHWAEEALLALIEHVATHAAEAPLMILAQARWELLEQRPEWGRGVRRLTALQLHPLGEAPRRQLIRALCQAHGLPEALGEQLGRQAAGNPLFLEELVAMAAEHGGVEQGVPSVIKGLLAARLDSLPPDERATLQRAAVFGKSFWAAGLRELDAPASLMMALDALVARDLVRPRPRSQIRGDQEYSFKHDLLRDVAYEMLPRAVRRELHIRAAAWIQRAAGERQDEHLDLLAHHAIQAGRTTEAIDFLSCAAERAGRAAAHHEEAALLATAAALAEQEVRPTQAAELRFRRGVALARVARHAEARHERERAFDGLPSEARATRAELLVHLATVCHWLFDVEHTRAHARAALALAETIGRTDLAAGAMGALAFADSSDGALEASQAEYARVRSGWPAARAAPGAGRRDARPHPLLDWTLRGGDRSLAAGGRSESGGERQLQHNPRAERPGPGAYSGWTLRRGAPLIR